MRRKYDPAARRMYYEKFKSRHTAKMKEYYLLHKEQILENVKKYRILNREKLDDKKRDFIKTPEGKELRRKIMEKHNSTYPERRKARQLIGNRIRDRKLNRKPCEVCGTTDTQAHHINYNKPLVVKWLCHLHHQQIHGKLLWKK